MVIKKNTKEVDGLKKYLELNSILKIVSILFILSITVLATVNIFNGKDNRLKDQNVISVSGHGEINVKPDTTKFTISVTESGKDMKSSQDAAKNKINNAIAILKQNGVPEKNIKNINYNTYPKYSSRTSICAPLSAINNSSISSSIAAPAIAKVGVKSTVVSKASSTKTAVTASSCTEKTSEIVGYETNQSIEVKITDISKNPDLAGILIVTVGAAGVQTSEVTNFVDNVELSKQYAREQAIQKAKIQARDIANSLGVKLGQITSFSENTNGGYPYPMMMSAKSMESADSAPINIPVGENKITSDVTITYSIK